MDSLKTLFEKGEYELLLTLTDGANDPESLFFRLSSFLSLAKPKEALELLLDNRKILFGYKPLATIKANFELRFMLKQFDEAYRDIDFYQNEPYVSQEVEETLASLQENVRANEKASYLNKKLGEDEILEKLTNPKDDFDALLALNQVKKMNTSRYPEEIRLLASSSRNKDVRTFALLILVADKNNEPLRFLNYDGTFSKVVPSALEAPYSSSSYQEFVRLLSLENKNPFLVKTARSIADQFIMVAYPLKAFEDIQVFKRAVLSLAKEYLGEKDDLPPGDSAKEKKDKIFAALKENPPLN